MRHLALVLAVALSGAGLKGGPPGLAGLTAGTPGAAGPNAGQDRPKSAPANPSFVIAVDGGDIVMVDASAGTRRQITRTSGAESNPRWARHDTHATYVRDGNLFIVPIDGAAGALVTQLTDVGPKKP